MIPCIYKSYLKKTTKNVPFKYNLSFFGFLSYAQYQKFQELISFFEIFDNSLLPISFLVYNKIFCINTIDNNLFEKSLLILDKINNIKIYIIGFITFFFLLRFLKNANLKSIYK